MVFEFNGVNISWGTAMRHLRQAQITQIFVSYWVKFSEACFV